MIQDEANVYQIDSVSILPSEDADDPFLATLTDGDEEVHIWAYDREKAANTVHALRAVADALEANIPALPAAADGPTRPLSIHNHAGLADPGAV